MHSSNELKRGSDNRKSQYAAATYFHSGVASHHSSTYCTIVTTKTTAVTMMHHIRNHGGLTLRTSPRNYPTVASCTNNVKYCPLCISRYNHASTCPLLSDATAASSSAKSILNWQIFGQDTRTVRETES